MCDVCYLFYPIFVLSSSPTPISFPRTTTKQTQQGEDVAEKVPQQLHIAPRRNHQQQALPATTYDPPAPLLPPLPREEPPPPTAIKVEKNWGDNASPRDLAGGPSFRDDAPGEMAAVGGGRGVSAGNGGQGGRGRGGAPSLDKGGGGNPGEDGAGSVVVACLVSFPQRHVFLGGKS